LVTVSQAATGAVLVAADDFGHLGYANPINVFSLPSLSIEQSGQSALISWPAAGPAFVLETTSDFSSWSPLSPPTQLFGDKYEARVKISATRSFYRLRFGAP
jgi:hypothetical protein